jgi:hypothetical protein
MYGLGTRSYNRSTEARANKLARKEATEKYLASPRKEVIVGPMCNCQSFDLPHELIRHRELSSEHDWSLEKHRYKPVWGY